MAVSFQEDVVDQTGGADADRGGEDAALVERVDVVDLDPGRGGEAARAPRRESASRARAGGRARAARSSAREVGVARGEREAVRVADGREDAQLEVAVEVEVAQHAAQDGDLLRVLLAEVGGLRADDVEELQADVATPRKWPGRARPRASTPSSSTSTQVWKPRRIELLLPAARRGSRRLPRSASSRSRASSRG